MTFLQTPPFNSHIMLENGMNYAPALSTSDSRIIEEHVEVTPTDSLASISDERLRITFEIERTLSEIRAARYKRVALQFPDGMLQAAPRVLGLLDRGLKDQPKARDGSPEPAGTSSSPDREPATKFYILGDTSYGACCVDEIAAEHVDADAVVHYGRSCLSPTARLPVIYCFTHQPLENLSRLYDDFKVAFPDKDTQAIVMADVTYQYLLPEIVAYLGKEDYTNLHQADVYHDPSSPLPNRTVPGEVSDHPDKLRTWHLFHISQPSDSLLLTLSSRVSSIHIFPTSQDSPPSSSHTLSPQSTSRALNRRYALITSVTTVSIFGILINTLSVKNYLHIAERVKAQIAQAGKKSYTFVVGKLNAAKVANFSEIGAWVVIGCWESSLIDSKDFWKPVITPFELELALKSDSERVWTGEWTSDWQALLDQPGKTDGVGIEAKSPKASQDDGEIENSDSDSDSSPPEFDLRTGRYVSQSRPMKVVEGSNVNESGSSTSIIKRSKGELLAVGGDPSPGAEYLQNKRTWKGLGSDFEIAYEEPGTLVEEGRSGIARGYVYSSESSKT